MKWIRLVLACCCALIRVLPAGAQTPEDYEKMKAAYEAAAQDRDNLRAQAQILLQYKGDIAAMQKQREQMNAERAAWEQEKQDLLRKASLFQEKIDSLQAAVKDAEKRAFDLEQERDQAKQKITAAKGDVLVIGNLQQKIKDQQQRLRRAERDSGVLKKKMDRALENLAKQKIVEQTVREQLKESNEKYQTALEDNKALLRKLDEQPKQYAELAREHKILLQRTGTMHYNLGVFYTKNKEFPRAITEFEKAVELNDADAQSFFNLGYIYAEYYENRPKAIENFQKYLALAKKGDKDIDWVKRYILTWQTWEGKRSVK
ncbi:MAG: hypothetical protein NC924_05990 [Candidatus Omnitrophica bacterium]|nr:hypothetical protein [Candidatus Omnitrophota bacterium]